MKIILPYKINQTIMLTTNRIQTKVTGFKGTINSDREIVGYFRVETEHGNVLLDGIKTPPTANEYNIEPKHNLDDNVLYHDDNPYRNKIIKRGKINAIHFDFDCYSKVYFYGIHNNYQNIRMLDYNIYTSVSDFKNRTKPRRELKEGERYILRNYMVQQKYLQPIKVDKHTTIHSKDRGEKIRNCYLYVSVDKFNNRMLAQIN